MYRRLICNRRLIFALALAPFMASASSAQTTLRYVPQADLKILDPVWTTAQLTQAHALMVYDQLFALDSKLEPRPQMVETWQEDPDGLAWRFTLRPGQKFSDGSPVAAKDAVASLKRWAARAPDGQLMMASVQSIATTSQLSFEIRLKRPFPPMLPTLANATTPLFVMREAEALTDPYKQVTSVIGSGPFAYVPEERVDGHLVVYRKNTYALPRSEPPDGMAGGKVAKVDRVEWITMPDAGVAVSALRNGEVDVLENAPYDLLDVIEADPALAVSIIDPLGQQAIVRFNELIPPFDDPKVRQAMLLAVDRAAYLAATVGRPRFERDCASFFICGTVSESSAGSAAYSKPDLAAAKRLLAASSYQGEPVVVLDPTDYAVMHALTLVTADRLKSVGFAVDIQALPWSQLLGRRAVKDAPKDGRGGWHVFHTTVPSVAMISPLANFLLASSCDGKNWFGWPCDPELESLRLSFLDAKGADAQRKVYDAIQMRAWTSVPFLPVGQITKPIAHRKSVSGFVSSPILALWNVEKK